MSADNWTICPRCHAKRQEQLEKLQAKLDASYGKVPLETFDAKRAEVAKALAVPESASMREDYELGVDSDGYFTIDYRCSCDCGFHYEFETSMNALEALAKAEGR